MPDIRYSDSTKSYEFLLENHAKKNLSIDVGGNISSRNVSEIYLGLGYKTFTGPLSDHHLGLYSGRFYQALNANSRIYFPGKRLYYVQPTIVLNKWDYLGTQDFLIADTKPDVLEQIDRKFSVKIGFPLGNDFKLEWESGYVNDSHEFSNGKVLSTSDTLDEMEFSGWKNGLIISSNNLDRKQFPAHGRILDFRAFYINGHERYYPGSTSVQDGSMKNDRNWFFSKFTYQEYRQFARHYSLGWQVEALVSNQPYFSNYMASLIVAPTFYPLADSRTIFLENFKAHNYLAGGLKNIFPLNHNLEFRLEGYVFLPERQMLADDKMPHDGAAFSSVSLAGTAALVFHSPIGPISANLNYYDDQQNKLGFMLSLGYLIFNDKSIE